MNREKKKRSGKTYFLVILIAIIIGFVSYLFNKKVLDSSIFSIFFIIVSISYLSVRKKLIVAAKIKKMETAFPDFIELVASNLNAGLTVDESLLLSSRKEFAPLDEEINLLGKDIATGKDINLALIAMANRIKSDKIQKTIELIVSGIKSGGNLSILLEEISQNMREREFMEKRAASNVLMYVIFIFIAVGFGAPMLFGLSTALVKILTDIIAQLPSTGTVSNMPLTITKVGISLNFITYFSVIFLIVIDSLASLIIGLVNKGDEKEGLKYLVPLWITSLLTYFIVRIFLINNISGLFSHVG